MTTVSENGSAVLELLAEDYGSATAVRALWQWAGGREAEIEWSERSEDTWERLWILADRPGAGATQLSLVREVLEDSPGHPVLLEFLLAVAEERFADLIPAADFLLLELERLQESGYSLAALRDYLTAFPARGWSATFAVMAPALHERGTAPERERLLASLEPLLSLTALLEELPVLRDALQVSPEQGRTDALRELERHQAQLESIDEPECQELADLIKRTLASFGLRRSPSQALLTSKLTSLIARARVHGGPESVRLDAIAEGLRAALWGTAPRDPLLEDEDEE